MTPLLKTSLTAYVTPEQLIVAVVLAVAAADTQYAYRPPQPSASARSDFIEVVPILRDNRVHDEAGSYNYDVETGNGIKLSQSGSPSGPEGAVVKAGQYS